MEELKETYRLWYEYTRRNPRLIDLHNKCKNLDLKKTFKTIGADLSEVIRAKNKDKKVDDTLIHITDITTYSTVKKFFELGFERFWEKEVKFHKERKSVSTGRKFLKSRLEEIVDLFKMIYKRDPDLNEYINFCSSMMCGDIFEVLFFIRPFDKNFDEISTEIRKELEIHYSNLKSKNHISNKYKKLKRVDEKKLNLYLTAYDLYENTKNIDDVVRLIFGNIDKDTDESYDSKITMSYRYISKAQRIIMNTESGIFPGNYKEPVDEKKKNLEETKKYKLFLQKSVGEDPT